MNSKPLTDYELELAKVKHIAQTLDLMNDALKPKKSADTLKQYEYSDIGLGWTLHASYEVEHERGERPVVQVVRLELNTGNHIFPLSLRDITGTDLVEIEALIADQEETDARDAALHLYEMRNDGYEGC